MFFFSSLFFTRFFDHLTLTYLLTTACQLKKSSFKFQERTESERVEDTYNNSEFLLESCDMSLMESSQAVANTEISVLVLAMVNLEVMFLTRTECSLNNSKAKSSRIVCCLIVVVQQYLSIVELITRMIKIMAVKIQKSTIIL